MAEIKQLQQVLEHNQARMKELGEVFQNQMSMIVKEVTSSLQTLSRIEREFQLSDARLDEQQASISHSQEQLNQLREFGSAMEAKIAGLYTELGEIQKEIAVLRATLMEKSGRLETVEADLAQRKARLESQTTLLEEKQKELGRLQASKDQELANQKETLSVAKKQVNEVKKKNPVADYLLSEAHEPPELGILALLIHQKEVPITEIKRMAKSPPAITTRVLKEMENKGIVELTGSDTARIAISL
ncbi:MAG: hypothetical protein ACFFCF_08895 [Promethearchaeota archaeon]